MTSNPRSRGRSAIALLVVAALFSASGFGQSQTPATQPASAAIPYTTQVRPEFSALKPISASTPKSIDDLKAIQARAEAVVKMALPATVCLSITTTGPDPLLNGGDGRYIEEGSGVIVSKDGYILTAGHVSGKPGQRVRVILADGSSYRGIALGANTQIDSGMVKITDRGTFPFVPLGDTSRVVPGQWVIALGHPGGYQENRPPVVRIGRVLNDPSHAVDRSRGKTPYIQTDCELIMGDSGGPLFDLDGRLVGINSRIGIDATSNIHVPIDTFTDTWERLAKSEQWGGSNNAIFAGGGGRSNGMGGTRAAAPQAPPKAYLGLQPIEDANGPLTISQVTYGTAADKAGILPQDIITRFDGQIVKTVDDLSALLAKHKPGDIVTLDLVRGAKQVQAKVTLDAAPR